LISSIKSTKKLKKQHWKLREGFLLDLAEAIEKRGKLKKANIVKNLIIVENQRAMFHKLAAINKKKG